MMNKTGETLARVHTHTHTHTSNLRENKINKEHIELSSLCIFLM